MATQYRVFIDHGDSTSLVIKTYDLKEFTAAVEREAAEGKRLIVQPVEVPDRCPAHNLPGPARYMSDRARR